MPKSKEQEILERQRKLAAQMVAAKPPAAPPPKFTTRTTKPKAVISKAKPKPAVIDLTKPSSSLPMKRPPPPMKRPSLKRPTMNKTSASHVLAAARAKATTGEDSPPPAAAASSIVAPNPSSASLDGKPSPRLKRKTIPKEKTASLLSGIVNGVSGGNINSGDASASLRTYEAEDFWKNLRAWDVPSHLYYQHLQQKGTAEEPQVHKKPIPNTFINSRHYVAAWAPLLLSECRAQLLQELTMKMTAPTLVQVKVTDARPRNRRHMDTTAAADTMDSHQTDGFITVHTRERSNAVNFMANDLVLLIQTTHRNVLRDIVRGNGVPVDASDPTAAFAGISLVGHTEQSRREINGMMLKISKRKWTTVGKNEMYLVKIGANVTALREFCSLCCVDRLPMKQYLLGEQLQKEENRRKLSRNQSKDSLLQQMGGELLGKGFLQYAGDKFNQSQLTAIAASAHEYGEGGFTLIKGPPGTGKTTTLVAVLNSLHIRQYNKYYDEVRRIATKPTGNRGESALNQARRAKPRLLVCAPSNAAIDNIILKIMEDGFIDGEGRRYNPSMIRIGVGQSDAVRDVSLENKVDAIFSEHSDAQQLQASILGFKGELQRLSRDITALRHRIQAILTAAPYDLSDDWEIRIDEERFEASGKAYFVNHKTHQTTYEVPSGPGPGDRKFKATSMPEARAYTSRLVKLIENYFSIKNRLERCSIVKASTELGANQFEIRLHLEENVLNTVHMVMTTLGSAGGRSLEAAEKFEVVVVDEAAQSVEMSALAALRLGSKHSVLVGDPQQLPATIFNMSGRNSKYDRSLFQRLEEAGQPVYMLNEQYRMHPNISHFPRNIFYGGSLKDGPNVTKPDYGNPLIQMVCGALPNFKPFTILDLDSSEERGGTSLSNLSEAKLAIYLYDQLKIVSKGLSTNTKVAVITPYAEQSRLLRRIFTDHLGPRWETMVEVNTVDAFQGREQNIVIFSAVRAAGSQGIGFLADVRRMNVALTRAKHFLFVIARCQSITVNPYWSDLVTHARETSAVVKVGMIGRGKTASFSHVSSWLPGDGRTNGPSAPMPGRGRHGPNNHRHQKPPAKPQNSMQPWNHPRDPRSR